MEDIARFSKRAVDYLFDRPPQNEDASPIWCLGRSYESRYRAQPQTVSEHGSPSDRSESAVSHADSAVVTDEQPKPKDHAEVSDEELVKSFHQVQLSKSMDDEDLGWPAEFLDDFDSRIWMTYRNNFPPIAKSTDPAAASSMSFATKLRNLTNQGGFTSDTGWGCMIRSGQSLLANAILILQLGRDWRRNTHEHKDEQDVLSLFADSPDAPYSIHRFVEHGAQACGTYPGEWFGPSATARCIRALTDKHTYHNLRVYARPNDSDVYIDAVHATATQKSPNDTFHPTLILLGIRLGIDKVTPAYHSGLKAALELPYSLGIAGGRPSSSHYFIGHQADQFFYLDPHTTRPALSAQPTLEETATCHTRRLRRIPLAEMDPSMLLGFLVKTNQEFEDWVRLVGEMPGKAIIHVHDTEPRYALGGSGERAGAEDEVETLDEMEESAGEEAGEGEGGVEVEVEGEVERDGELVKREVEEEGELVRKEDVGV